MAGECPVCSTQLVNQHEHPGRYFFECPRCGPFSMSPHALALLPVDLTCVEDGAKKLSYALTKATKKEQWAFITDDLLENLIRNTSLPGLAEQLNELVSWLAENQPDPGAEIQMTEQIEAASGAKSSAAFAFVCGHARDQGLIDVLVERMLSGEYLLGPARLTFQGWQYYEELQRGNSTSRTVFMAMQFGDKELDAIYRDHFKAAVEATGFDLKRLDEGQPAGLIDDRLRVEIRQARFLIADLTHHNKGAYWEAGYAEGLGKPVIYTCRRDAFNNDGTHFDTNHHLSLSWVPQRGTLWYSQQLTAPIA